VDRYLKKYTEAAGREMRIDKSLRARCLSGNGSGGGACLEYLRNVAEVARRQWTQFNDFLIVSGIAVFGVCLMYEINNYR